MSRVASAIAGVLMLGGPDRGTDAIDGEPAGGLNASDGRGYAPTRAASTAGAIPLTSDPDAWLDGHADGAAVLGDLAAIAIARCEA